MKFKTHSKNLMVSLALIIAISGVVFPLTQEAQEKPKEKEKIEAAHYAVSAATSEIKVDGVLDEQAWEDAAVSTLPY
jgi:hypothetical protein